MVPSAIFFSVFFPGDVFYWRGNMLSWGAWPFFDRGVRCFRLCLLLFSSVFLLAHLVVLRVVSSFDVPLGCFCHLCRGPFLFLPPPPPPFCHFQCNCVFAFLLFGRAGLLSFPGGRWRGFTSIISRLLLVAAMIFGAGHRCRCAVCGGKVRPLYFLGYCGNCEGFRCF